jgi:hypothetical protein
LNSEV